VTFFINLYLVLFTYVYYIKIYISYIFLLLDIISFFVIKINKFIKKCYKRLASINVSYTRKK